MRRRVMRWMWDGCPEWTWWLLNDRLVGRLLCALVGHEPICNRCHLPDPDHCAWCMKRMPGQAHPECPR